MFVLFDTKRTGVDVSIPLNLLKCLFSWMSLSISLLSSKDIFEKLNWHFYRWLSPRGQKTPLEKRNRIIWKRGWSRKRRCQELKEPTLCCFEPIVKSVIPVTGTGQSDPVRIIQDLCLNGDSVVLSSRWSQVLVGPSQCSWSWRLSMTNPMWVTSVPPS